MERRTALAKRLELYRSAQVDIDAVAWSKQSDILRMISFYTRRIWRDVIGWRLEKGVRQLVVFIFLLLFFFFTKFPRCDFHLFLGDILVIFMYDTFIYTFKMIQECVLFSIRCMLIANVLSLSFYIYNSLHYKLWRCKSQHNVNYNQCQNGLAFIYKFDYIPLH